MYTLSEKQKQALVNMWAVLGKWVDDIEDYFLDKDQFQKYFEWFKEQIEKKIKSQKKAKSFKKAVELWKVDLKKVQENREKRILDYYSKAEVLKQKGLEYHIKFATSKKRLEEWMLKKTNGNIDLVNTVISTCIINEELFIRPQVQIWIKKWKSDYEISSNLRQKWFEKQLVDEVLQEERELKEVVLNPTVVHIKIRELLRKWNSKYSIESEIKYKFWLDKEQVEDYLSEYDFDDNVQGDNKLTKEIESLRKKWKKDFEIIWICLWKKFEYKKVQEQLKRS